MTPIGVAVFAALLLLVSIERSNSQTGFSYDRQDLWPDNCNVPTAMRQTPIDIITRDVQRNSSLKELEFNDVWTATLDGTFSNNGLTPRFVGSTGGIAAVRNRLGPYDLLNFHLHWGRENDQGTGHRINGEEFRLEFRFVTLLQGEGLVNLGNTSRGDLISVISVLAEVDDTAEISGAWEKLNISAIIGAGNSTAVTGLSYSSVLPKNRDYYYPGSQTSPPCYEFVQWFVLQNRIKVPRPFLEQLRTVRNFNDEPITLNNRDAQPLNNRIVSVLPSSVALDLVFTNDTPQVNGSGFLHAEFATNTPGTDIFLTCRLEGPGGTITQDCKHACCI